MSSDAIHMWRGMRRTIFLMLALGAAVGGVGVFWLLGPTHSLVTLVTILCFALGFWVTELLIGILTRLKTANASAILLLLVAKFAWWGGLFYAAKYLPADLKIGVAIGMGVFLLSLLLAGLGQFGFPRISDGKPPSNP